MFVQMLKLDVFHMNIDDLTQETSIVLSKPVSVSQPWSKPLLTQFSLSYLYFHLVWTVLCVS